MGLFLLCLSWLRILRTSGWLKEGGRKIIAPSAGGNCPSQKTTPSTASATPTVAIGCAQSAMRNSGKAQISFLRLTPRSLSGEWDSRASLVARRSTYIGTAVFLAGLKNGIFTILAVTFWRMASMVISICSLLPSLECEVSMLASAIIFFRTGDQVVDVALPTCF